MKIIIKLTLLLVFAFPLLSQDPVSADVLTEAEPRDPCFEITYHYEYNGHPGANYINKDCPENTKISFTIENKCSDPWYKNYVYSIDIGGEHHYTTFIDGEEKINYELDITEFIIPLLAESGGLITIDVSIHTLITGTDIFDTGNVTIINGQDLIVICDGDSYEFSEFSHNDVSFLKCYSEGPGIKNFCCCFEGDQSALCGSDKRLYRFDFEATESTSTSTSSTGSISIGGQLTQYGFSGSTGYEISHEFSSNSTSATSQTYRIDHYLSNDLPGQCFNIGYFFDLDVYKTYSVTTNCELGDGMPMYQGEYSVLSGSVEEALNIIPCNIRPVSENECPPITIKISIDRHKNSVADCLGDILLDIEGSDEDNLEIYWTMNGQHVLNTKDLYGFPHGVYEVEVYDACCNKYSETVTFCDEVLPITDYVYNETNNEWCRDIDCFCDDETKSGSKSNVLEECITPDEIKIIYEDQKCIETHYYKGEKLGQVNAVDADFNTVYDHDEEECLYQYFCEEGEILETVNDDPESAFWTYDEDDDKCFLTVECGDKLFEDIIELDPEEYSWTYDEEKDVCYLNVKCEDEWLNEVLEEDVEIEWSWNANNSYCEAQEIECDGEETEIEYTVDPEDYYWSLEDWDGDCYLNVKCGEEWLYEVEETDPEIEWEYDEDNGECQSNYVECGGEIAESNVSKAPYDVTDWIYTTINCYRSVYCVSGGEEFEEEGEVEFIQTGQGSDCDGNFYYYDVYCNNDFIEQICNEGLLDIEITDRKLLNTKDIQITQIDNAILAKIASENNQLRHLSLHSMNGQLVARSSSIEDVISLNTDRINTGMYILNIVEDKRLLAVQKIIITK